MISRNKKVSHLGPSKLEHSNKGVGEGVIIRTRDFRRRGRRALFRVPFRLESKRFSEREKHAIAAGHDILHDASDDLLPNSARDG